MKLKRKMSHTDGRTEWHYGNRQIVLQKHQGGHIEISAYGIDSILEYIFLECDYQNAIDAIQNAINDGKQATIDLLNQIENKGCHAIMDAVSEDLETDIAEFVSKNFKSLI